MPDFQAIPNNSRFKDLTGKVFTKLTVIGYVGRQPGSSRWSCRCECGNDVEVSASHLQSGDCKSCGCLKSERLSSFNLKHGESRQGKRTKEYRAWCKMIDRCEKPSNIRWAEYGGRGITICGQWRESFEAFLLDVGRAPTDKHSINRINNDGNYEPGNVEWAAPTDQVRNRSNTVLVEYEGQSVPLAEVCERHGLRLALVRQRIFRDGYTLEKALTEKVQNGGWRPRKA